MEIDKEFIKTLNSHGQLRKPIFFAIDFDGKEWFVENENVLFKLQDKQNYAIEKKIKSLHVKVEKYIDFSQYKTAFDSVQDNIKAGNTYLLNLTFPTILQEDLDLESIFYASDAPFKLLYKDRFLCFSPERFVQIQGNTISTYPMKGTIDADIHDAKEKILANMKEKAEHVMVVDLLRNDIGIVAKEVHVKRFRYVQNINAGERNLLQVSSEICATLDENWHDNLGDIIAKMLPAGSITGTPKKKTVQIIKDLESYKRGFFTGVFGYYDGKNFDSAVMIRFIEKTSNGYVYKSGGGITCDSDALQEYQEMKDKVYVPLL